MTNKSTDDYRQGLTDATLKGMSRDISSLRTGQQQQQKRLDALPDLIRDAIKDTVTGRLNEQDKALARFGERITALEKWRWISYGVVASAAFVIPYIFKLMVQ